MKNPLLFAFIKILFAFGMVILAAAFKWIREQSKLRIIKEAILYHIRIFPYQDRLLYKTETDKFMEENHKQIVFFEKELWLNGFRGLFGLTFYLLFFYNTFSAYLVYFGVILIAWVLCELAMDIIKDRRWYKFCLIGAWIIAFIIISIFQNQLNDIEKQSMNQESSINVQKNIKH